MLARIYDRLKSTANWTLRVTAILFGAASIISIIVRYNDIILYDLFLDIYNMYSEVRDWLFWPLSELLKFLSRPVPDWLKQYIVPIPTTFKDLFILYLLPVGAYYRSGLETYIIDQRRYQDDPGEFKRQLLQAAKVHRIDGEELIERVIKGINNRWFYIYRNIRGGIRWPITMYRNIKEIIFGENLARIHGARLLTFVAQNVVVIIGVVILFFVFHFFWIK